MPQHIKAVIHPQFLKFVFVGFLNALIGYSVFLVGIYIFRLHYAMALFIAYVVGILNSYIWNKKWTFRSDGKIGREIIKFFLVYATIFCLNEGILFVLVDRFAIREALAQIAALIALAPTTFVLHKKWSFYNIEKNIESLHRYHK